jgi:hypothetical protein
MTKNSDMKTTKNDQRKMIKRKMIKSQKNIFK